MGMAQLVVTAVLVEGRSKSEVARSYGLSRRWVITLVQRFQAEGESGLLPRPRRPGSSPGRVDSAVEDDIVAVRKELDELGHDSGAQTIAEHLRRRHGHAPAVSTIWRVLTRRGFVVPQPHKRPKSSFVRFQAEQPNERWQLDITHVQLADGTDVEILNMIDDHARLCVASHARRVFKAADVVTSFTKAAATHGLPASMLSDNGAVFTGSYRGGGRVALELALAAHGIGFTHSRPYHPQTCGKVERFHQTLKKHLATRPAARSIPALQRQLDTFVAYDNTVRPHRALNRRTPAEAFAARPRAVPTGTPIDTGHYRVRQDRLDTTGVVTLRHNSRLHHIGIGRRHAGRRVLVLVKDLHIRVLTDTGELLRELTLDPSRDYQPQPKP
jgi:transposase InsO family protein